MKYPFLKSLKELSESSKYFRSLCFAYWTLYGNVALKNKKTPYERRYSSE